MKLLEEKPFSVLQFSLIGRDSERIILIRFLPHTFYEFSLLWKFIKKIKSRFPWFYNNPGYSDFNHRIFDDDFYYNIETVSRSLLKPFRLKFRGEHEFYDIFFSFWKMIPFYFPRPLEEELSVELSNFLLENNFRLYDYINSRFINTSSIDILEALNHVKEKEETDKVFLFS